MWFFSMCISAMSYDLALIQDFCVWIYFLWAFPSHLPSPWDGLCIILECITKFLGKCTHHLTGNSYANIKGNLSSPNCFLFSPRLLLKKVVRKQSLILICSALPCSLSWKWWSMRPSCFIAYIGSNTAKAVLSNNALTSGIAASQGLERMSLWKGFWGSCSKGNMPANHRSLLLSVGQDGGWLLSKTGKERTFYDFPL